MAAPPIPPQPARCPICGSPEVRPSKQHASWDELLSWMGRIPIRCQICNHRFYITGRGKRPDLVMAGLVALLATGLLGAGILLVTLIVNSRGNSGRGRRFR